MTGSLLLRILLGSGFALLGVILGSTEPAKADVITPDSVAGQNVTAAANFIRENGRSDMADNIVDFLKRGKLYSESINEPGTTAKTSSLSNITIEPTQVAPLTRPLDPDKQFRLVVNLAAILFHEKIHAHQSWGKFLSDSGEYDAWTQTIYEIDTWIYHARNKYDHSHSKADLENLGELADAKRAELDGFIENHCFGGNCALWKDLLDTVDALQAAVNKEAKRLAAEKPQQGNSKQIGMMVDQTDKKERYALVQTKAPAVVSTTQSWPGLALAPPSCFAGKAQRTTLEESLSDKLDDAKRAVDSASSVLAREKAESEVDGFAQLRALAAARPNCASHRRRRSEDDPLYLEDNPPQVPVTGSTSKKPGSEGPPPPPLDERGHGPRNSGVDAPYSGPSDESDDRIPQNMGDTPSYPDRPSTPHS